MSVQIADVMRSCCNFFDSGYIDGTFTVDGDELSPSYGIVDGMYIGIEGSTLHDGVYKYTDGTIEGADADLPAETFKGRIWLLAPPKSFVSMCELISEYDDKNPAGALQSESFGDYSYTRASGGNGKTATWQQAFATQLFGYRHMYTEVRI